MPQTSMEIYKALIDRCKQHVKMHTSVMFDPETGVQKTFVKGKLTEIKNFTPREKPNE